MEKPSARRDFAFGGVVLLPAPGFEGDGGHDGGDGMLVAKLDVGVGPLPRAQALQPMAIRSLAPGAAARTPAARPSAGGCSRDLQKVTAADRIRLSNGMGLVLLPVRIQRLWSPANQCEITTLYRGGEMRVCAAPLFVVQDLSCSIRSHSGRFLAATDSLKVAPRTEKSAGLTHEMFEFDAVGRCHKGGERFFELSPEARLP